jgi:ATP-dependent protease ClpP protease subunit
MNNSLRNRSEMKNKMLIRNEMGDDFDEGSIAMSNSSNTAPSNGAFLSDTIKIQSEFNSLYIQQVPESFLQIDGIDEDVFVKIQPHKKYSLWLKDFCESDKGLHDIFQTLRSSDPEDYLEIRIYSNGGYITELQTLYSTIKEMFYGRISTYLDNYGYSCGGFAFLFGDKRVSYEFSEFMVHQATFGVYGTQYSNEVQHNFIQKQTKRFSNKVMKEFFSKEEIDSMFTGKDYWFDAEEMARRNISTHTVVDGIELLSSDYLELLEWEEENPDQDREEFFKLLSEREMSEEEVVEEEVVEEEVVEEEVKPTKKVTRKKKG